MKVYLSSRLFVVALCNFICITVLSQLHQPAHSSTTRIATVQTRWNYDPATQPITLTELRRLIRSPKTTPTQHSLLINRATKSRLLEYAVVEYDKARQARPENPVLQSAFGSCVVGVNEFDWRYTPSNRTLLLSQRKATVVKQATDAIENAVRGKGMNVSFCWWAFGYMKLVGFEVQVQREYRSYKSGIDAFERAIELDPKNVDAHNLLAWGYLNPGPHQSVQRALLLARNITEFSPKTANAYYWQAMALFDLKKPQEAQAMMKKWQSLLPPNLRQKVPKSA